MEKLKIVTIIFLFAFGLFNTTAAAKPASVMLREGLYAEEVEGNIDGAIKIYEQIVQDNSASRNYVAQALYRQGMCYLKKKDEHGAKAVFGKLVAKYGDQTKIIEKAKPFLDDLMNYDPADLMPPETLVYVELGSPGKQIETILNMLKGTPFENPLTAIPGPGRQVGPGNKSPEDVLAALLNPSMMAEFKKIRGMAVGITAIGEFGPVGVTVLYPGKSDALRGIILAALGMAGQRSEPIEGMETLNIQNNVLAAYDDKLIITAPAEQLKWCVRQYKGIISEPTLASSNKPFAKVSKKARQDNALTIWANVDEVHTGISKQFPAGQSPKEMLLANALIDFGNIDDLIMYLSIEESGLAYKADVSFKDGHHCLAYDMIRTPNLSKTALEAVPSDAVALVSLALGQANEAQIETVRKKIQNVTGLDIGREIFANIEQVTLFAMPSDKAFIGDVPLLPNIGLAITSQNPQQTRQVLATVLRTANLTAEGQQAGQTDTSSNSYQIGMAGDQRLYCYMDQLNKTTVLSLNKDITDASISAIKQRKSACTAGPLKDSISKLSSATSKLALVNIGGAIRVATPAIIEDFENSHRERIQQALGQLAQSCSQTTVELRTDEQLNSFALNAAITGLPPLNEVFGPVTEISQVTGQVRAKAWAKRKMAEIPATIAKATRAPVIDGTAEDIWSDAQKYQIGNIIYLPVSSANDLSADYRAMWDQENLYLFVDVVDDELKNDSIEFYYDDTVEVFIDADNSKDSGYGNNDYTYNFNWDRTRPSMEERGQPYWNDDIKFALVTSDNGYQLEIKFPWSALGVKPSAGVKIGLDVHVNDDDDGGERDSKFTWRDKEDDAWQNPQAFGTAELAGLIGWWKFDEGEGSTAADSSDNGNQGTLYGNPQWIDGQIGGALQLDGTDDYVDLPIGSVVASLTNCTFATWVNWSGLGDIWQRIFDFGSGANVNMFLTPSALNGPMRFAITTTGYTAEDRATAPDTLASGWHHVAVAIDASAHTIILYLDGSAVAQNTQATLNPSDLGATTNNWLGRSQYPDPYFNGSLDDFRIYNYVLKEADITALYNEGVRR